MHKIILLIIFLISFNSLKAEVINSLEVTGNKRVSEETVKIYGDIILKDKDYKEADLNNILKKLYETNLFEDVQVNLEGNTLKVKLKEYPIIKQLIIVGEKKKGYVKRIKETIQLKEKRSLIKSYLASDAETIRSFYSSIGYNFADVEIKVKEITQDSFDLLININRGEKTKITKINFIGNKSVRSSRLKDIIASEENKFWKVLTGNTNLNENLINLDSRLLVNYYKSIGFYDVKINSNLAQLKNNKEAELIFSIDEGTRYIINKISTNVDNVFDKNLFFPISKTYEKFVGDYYSPFKVKKILDEIDEIITNNNLQFVEHNVEENFDNDKINITVNIFEGKKVLVERINITGNYVTNENVIRGELIMDEGDPFTKLNLDKSIAEIKSRNIFKNVKYEIADGSKPNLKIININVEETSTGEISAGAGIGTNGGTFGFQIKENNWLGEGQSLAFDIEIDQESLSGSLSYNDPNYDFMGNSLTYAISSQQNDKPDKGYENSLYATSISTSFEQYRDVDVSLGLSASHDDLRTDASASDSLQKQRGTYNEIATNYGIAFDKRNRSFKPTSGTITTFGQSFPIYADKAFIANKFTTSAYKTFSEDVIGAAKFYLSSINGLGSDDVRISKRANLSSRRLRGFERNKIGPVDGTDYVGGNHAAALNLEANFPNFLPDDTGVDISTFLDFGNLWGVDYDGTINESNKIRSSTGILANWRSPIGPMSFVLSQNLSKADTDKTQSFSFNLGTTF
jgi:outer membrane protein insertion porin family